MIHDESGWNAILAAEPIIAEICPRSRVGLAILVWPRGSSADPDQVGVSG